MLTMQDISTLCQLASLVPFIWAWSAEKQHPRRSLSLLKATIFLTAVATILRP